MSSCTSFLTDYAKDSTKFMANELPKVLLLLKDLQIFYKRPTCSIFSCRYGQIPIRQRFWN